MLKPDRVYQKRGGVSSVLDNARSEAHAEDWTAEGQGIEAGGVTAEAAALEWTRLIETRSPIAIDVASYRSRRTGAGTVVARTAGRHAVWDDDDRGVLQRVEEAAIQRGATLETLLDAVPGGRVALGAYVVEVVEL